MKSKDQTPDKKAAAGQRSTIHQVAKLAEVSVGSASRVINNVSNVAPDIRERVQKAILELGFKPSQVAQSMRRGETRTVGVFVRDITAPVLAGFVKGAQDVLHEQGYTVLLACSDENPEREVGFLSAVGSGKVDGLIMTTSSEQDERLAQARSEVSVPTVLFDREVPGKFDSVLIAHDQGVAETLEHLHSLGHRRIALLTGGRDVYPSRSRIQGYENFYQSRGLPWDKNLISANNFSEEWAFLESSIMLSGAQPPTAIIVGGISMLAGAMRAIRARQLTIPDDISLVGNGDSELARFCKPSISVVTSDYTEIGRTCAGLLLARLRGQQPEEVRRIIVPAEYIMRGSSGVAPRGT